MFQLCYHNYSSVLENLSIAEEAIIAKAHLVVTILKLKVNNRFKLGAYRKIRGYAVFLSQNLKLLLILFLFNLATFKDVIHIV